MSQPSRTQATAYERYSLSKQYTHAVGLQTFETPDEPNQSAKFGKRRWASLRNLMPFTGLGGGRSRNMSPDSDIPSGEKLHPGASSSQRQAQKGNNGSSVLRPHEPIATGSGVIEGGLGPTGKPYHSHSFRFSLEWTEKPNRPGKSESGLDRPKLPVLAQAFLESFGPCQNVDDLREPTGVALRVSKYVGMALAEWESVVNEYQEFCERRRAEGVPSDSQVETPTLKVDSWRRGN